MASGGVDSGAVAFGRRAGAFSEVALRLGWGWFEAGWVRLRELERRRCRGCRRSSTACGSRISRTSISASRRRARAVERARRVGGASGSPTSSAITGDLLDASARRGRCCASSSQRLPLPAFADPRQPRPRDLARSAGARVRTSSDLEPATLLTRRGRDARAARARRLGRGARRARWSCAGGRRSIPNALSRSADLRILLCHYPRVVDRLEPGSVRSRARRPHARRPDHDAVSGRQGAVCAPDGALCSGASTGSAAGGHARLARPRHDVRPVPLRGAARGDGAGATFDR